MNRQQANELVLTKPYPEFRDGIRKTHEEVWINGLYGQPTEDAAWHQLRKNLTDFEESLPGFYCAKGVHAGVFSEAGSYNGITWKYYIHYAQYHQ